MLTALGVDSLGSGLFLPLSVIYFTVVSDLPLSDVGFALSAATAATLVVPLVAGHLADRYGGRRVVVAAQLLQAVGFAAYLVVDRLAILVVAALLVGIGERAFWTTVYTFIAQAAQDRDLDGWYARVSVVRSIGLGAGALLAGAVLSVGSDALYRVVIVANAATFVVAAVLLGFLVTEARPAAPRSAGRGGYRRIARDRPFLAFTLTNAAYSLCLTIVTVAISVYVVDGLKGPGWVAGVLFVVNTGLIIAGQARVTGAVERYRRTRVLAVAGLLFGAWAVSLAVAPLLPGWTLAPYLIVGMVVFTAAEMLQSPTSTALAAATASDQLRGRYLAVYGYGYQLAKMIAPVLFTQLYARGTALPWVAVAGIAAVTVPALLRLERVLPAEALRRTVDEVPA